MDVSVVVTVLNEAERSTSSTALAATLAGRDWEAIFVDDGSTDDTYAKLRALHERDPRVRVVRFKRNFGQHPAMHAGLPRARRAIMTMDGTCRTSPRTSRSSSTRSTASTSPPAAGSPGHSSGARPEPAINGLLRRFTGVGISDFGCAFNGSARGDRADARPDRQAEVHEGARPLLGRHVEEVDVAHAPSSSGSRYSPFRLDPPRAPRRRGLLAAAGAVDRRTLGLVCTLAAAGSASTASLTGSPTATSPGRSSPEQASFSSSACKDSSWR